jgi:hypothetical protein
MNYRTKRLIDYSKESILDELKQVAVHLGKETLTQADIDEHARVCSYTVTKRWGSLHRALLAAGLKSNREYKINKVDLLVELDRIWSQVGQQPIMSDLRRLKSKYSRKAYARHFGSWLKACEAYVDWKNKSFSEIPRIKQTIKLSQPLNRIFSSPSIEYGEPIDFLGLRHAPINEQGVVYLFGVLSKSLGFTVEAIRSDFPDCEAKREIPGKKGRWEKVSIEFEYMSSNFLQHNHDQSQCDIIVCWIHDWKECPIEVISLKNIMEHARNPK